MNRAFLSIGLTSIITSALGLFGFTAPAHACRATDNRIGGIDFNNCQMLVIVGGPSSKPVIAAYRRAQEKQLTVAIADYQTAFTANIAQWQTQRTLIVHKLSIGELALADIALVHSEKTITDINEPKVALLSK
jgi:hypothetical protein